MEQTETARALPAARLTLFAGFLVLVGLVVFGIAAPGTYTVYKLIHVFAAVVWVGGGAMITVLALLTERDGDPKALAALGAKAEYLALRLFVPASVLVFVFGILMMVEADLSWGQFWVVAGLIGFAATFLTGIGFLSPQTKKVSRLAEEHGVEHPATQAELKKLLLVARFDVALLLVIVADMAAKRFS